MSSLNLNEQERNLVAAMARDHHGRGSRLGFYASVLLPVIAFGGYGVLKRDFVAVAIALGGLLIFVCWRLSHELTNVEVYRSLFAKISNHEKSQAELGTPVIGDQPLGKRIG